MSHTPPIFIKHGKNSSAFLTLETPQQLVLFIHGFNGSATGSWNDFPSMIRSRSDFGNCDVFFYGYESLKGQANNNAIKFYSFLKFVCEGHPNKFGFIRKNLPSVFNYDRIIIIAHSLGAVITRRALLLAKADRKDWLPKTRMVLFAPAHKGARIQNLVSESLPALAKILAGIGLIAIPILDDLRPDSQTITRLIEDTKNYLSANDGNFTIAHSVIWADGELVVHNDIFCNDPVPTIFDNTRHMSVCKPDDTKFTVPYTAVVNALQP